MTYLNLNLEPESCSNTDMEGAFKEILRKVYEVYKQKNSDYGNSVGITYLMFGETSQLVRLWDKLLRLTTIYLRKDMNIKDERVEDTLEDLITYSVIALAQRLVYKDSTEELKKQFELFIKHANKDDGI